MADPATVYQFLVVLCANTGMLVGGFGCGFTSPYAQLLTNEFDVEKNFFDWIISANPIGSMLGALVGPKLANSLGRRLGLLMVYLIIITGWIIVSSAKSSSTLLLGRLVHSFGDGMSNGVTFMYLNEVMLKKYRGLAASFLNLSLNLGFPLAYTAGWLLPWRASAMFPIFLLIPIAVILYFLPESPAFLVTKNKYKEALLNLKKLRKSSDFTELDMFRCKESSNSTFAKCIENFSTSSNITQFSLVVSLLMLFPLTGSVSISFHALKICKDMGFENAHLVTILIGLLRTMGLIISSFLIHKCGRRLSVLLSSFLVSICSLLLTILLSIKSLGYVIPGLGSYLAYVLALLILCYMFAAGLGMMSVHWILMAEWPTMENKVVTTTVASVGFYMAASGSIHVTTFLQDNIGTTGMFIFFTTVCSIYFCICYFFVPETSGYTFEEYSRISNQKQIWKKQNQRNKPLNGLLEDNSITDVFASNIKKGSESQTSNLRVRRFSHSQT